MPQRILFFAEAVSLAHVARPAVLAERLEADGHAIDFACADRFSAVPRRPAWRLHTVTSPTPETFMARLAAGEPVLNGFELAAAVDEDLAVISRSQPNLVVGDFRLSLSIAARLARVPYVAITNAHWSPWRQPLPDRAPSHAVGQAIGYRAFDAVFGVLWPALQRPHLAAPNRLRRRHGLAGFSSLDAWYADGDFCAFADTPGLVACQPGLPAQSRYIGPVVWSPPIALPAWWPQAVAPGAPLVYVSMGSTGAVSLLPMLVATCRARGARCIVSTAGRGGLPAPADGVFAADYLPGSPACAKAALVVCNGGSATVHQALAAGRPVLGICSNLDQVRTMQHVEHSGAGLWLRSGEATPQRIDALLARLLGEAGFSRAAQRHAAEIAMLAQQAPFEKLVVAALQPQAYAA